MPSPLTAVRCELAPADAFIPENDPDGKCCPYMQILSVENVVLSRRTEPTEERLLHLPDDMSARFVDFATQIGKPGAYNCHLFARAMIGYTAQQLQDTGLDYDLATSALKEPPNAGLSDLTRVPALNTGEAGVIGMLYTDFLPRPQSARFPHSLVGLNQTENLQVTTTNGALGIVNNAAILSYYHGGQSDRIATLFSVAPESYQPQIPLPC